MSNMWPVGHANTQMSTGYARPKISLITVPEMWKPWSGRTGSELQMNQLSLRNNRLKFKTAGKLPIVLEEFIEEYTPI